MNNIINPDDRDYYDGKLYEVDIWPGSGYQSATFKVYAANEQEALELVVADAELNNENLLMSIPEMENYIAEDWSEECNKFMQENEDRDADEYTFAEEYLNYIYVDATMQGASQPYFINGKNLVINEISENDKVEESKEVKECQDKLVEDTDSEEHTIWDSEIDYYDEEYMNEVRENQYQDYLDNFEPSEPLSFEDWVMSDECYDTHYHWFEDSGVTEWTDLVDAYKDEFKEDYDEYVANYKDEPLPFDKWYNDYIEESSYDDWNTLKEDLENNILPSIERQMNYNCLILSGYYGSNYPDFKSSGNGGKMFEDVDEFEDYMSRFDRTIITTQAGILGSSLYDHDGTVSGEFYTLPENLTELVKAMNYETYVDIPEDITDEQDILDTVMDQFEEDLVYGNVDVRDLTEHIDLLVPIKDTISGYTPDEPKENKTEALEDNSEPITSSINADSCKVNDDIVTGSAELVQYDGSEYNPVSDEFTFEYNRKDKTIKVTSDNEKEIIKDLDEKEIMNNIEDNILPEITESVSDDKLEKTESIQSTADPVTKSKLETAKDKQQDKEIENCTNIKKVEAVEYISRKEYNEMPEDYKTTIEKTLQARQAVGDNVDELRNLYKNLGYEETDPMIMVNDNGGTVLKPVKIQEEKEITFVDKDDILATTTNGGKFEIKLDDEAEEPYYTIRYTDKDNNAKEVFGFDTVYNSDEEAKQVFKDMLNDNEKYTKLVKSLTESKLNEDEPQEETLDEAINRAHQEEISAINTYDTILSKTDETTDTKLVDMIEEIKADEEDHKLLLQHYIETGEALTDDELKELKDKSSEVPDIEEKLTNTMEESKNIKTEKASITVTRDVNSEAEALDLVNDTSYFDIGDEVDVTDWNNRTYTVKKTKDYKYKDGKRIDECTSKKESKLVEENSTITEELNTGVLPIVAVDMYSLSDSLNEYDISQEDLDEIVQELAPKYIEDTLSEILPNVSVVTKSVYHPRQYNFEGDELEFSLTVDKQAYETLKENALNNPEFTTFLKDNYSSRSGFISSMADNIDEFKEQPEWKQMVQVIMFNIPNDKIQENNDHYVDEFLEKVSMSAETIVDESKSINENEEELEFDPSNEVDDEAMNTEFKVGDVVADLVDGDIAIVEALPTTDDGTYTLRFVTGVCKGDAYQYKKGRFTMVTHEDIRKEALEIYNDNMKPEDNPLKKENLEKKEETVNKTFAEFKKNN